MMCYYLLAKVCIFYENKIFVCKYCNKEFSFNNNRYRHEQKCKIIFEEKQNNEIKLAEISGQQVDIAGAQGDLLEAENRKIEVQKNNLAKFKPSQLRLQRYGHS